MRCFLIVVTLLASTHAGAAGFQGRQDVHDFILDVSERHGFSVAELRALFRKTRPVPAVIRAIKPPADPGIRSWSAYRARFVEPSRLAAGHRFMHVHASTLAKAEKRFGVPAEIIAAIIGVETIYGKITGRFNTFSALATLAFDYPPRSELFRRELEELLLLAREEGKNPRDYRGSYAGALGLPQFLPSSRRRWGIDFSGDGVTDLSGSAEDAIGSVANFLAEHGWITGGLIAVPVDVTGQGIQGLLDEGIVPKSRPLDWTTRGVSFSKVGAGDTATELWQTEAYQQPAALIDLATPNQPTEFRVGYANFYVITRYNRSSFYAAVVADFAAELSGSK